MTLAAAVLFSILAMKITADGEPVVAMYVLVAGVALNIILGRLILHFSWRTGPAPRYSPRLWSAFAAWQAGTLLTVWAWTEQMPSAPFEIAGPALIGAAPLILLAARNTPYFWPNGALHDARELRLSLVGLVPAGVSCGMSSLLLALAFSRQAHPALDDIALSLLVFGSLLPTGFTYLAIFARSRPRALDVRASEA